MKTLFLRATDVVNDDNWRWILTDERGSVIADQIVSLKPTTPEYQGFADLPGYLSRYSAPDRRGASEAVLLDRLGDWLGSNVLGALGRIIADHNPSSVHVLLPSYLKQLRNRPLGLAKLGGIPMALLTGLVTSVSEDPEAEISRERNKAGMRLKAPIGDRLRLLAVFSLPTPRSPGSLRRERYELSHLIHDVGSRSGAAIELRVLQYGVTRENLASVIEEGAGWDVIHLAGHGISTGPGYVLQRKDGSPDVLSTSELTSLMHRCRSRLKLVVISHSQSAAVAVAERRRHLGLHDLPRPQTPAEEASAQDRSTPLSDLGVRLATQLDCAVVVSRLPLADEATLKFNARLYSGLFEVHEPVSKAMSAAIKEAADVGRAAGLMAAASCVAFGPRAPSLDLAPPAQVKSSGASDPVPTDFPPEPVRFVGHDRPMARASAALAPESDQAGVLFHGLTGAGKMTCAIELAYRHVDAFQQLVWWRTAEAGMADQLADLGIRLEEQLAGFTFGGAALGDAGHYHQQLSDLTTLLENFRLLVVLTGLDSLLTSEGKWRDQRWHELVDVLANQRGRSRVILTTGVRPRTGDLERILSLAVNSLSLDETIMLAEELPNLGPLLHADADLETSENVAGIGQDQLMVRAVLNLAQGNPKLLELANAAAADPEQLRAQLMAWATPATDQGAEAFVQSGISALNSERFSADLNNWMSAALATLPSEQRLFSQFVACLAENDRRSVIIEDNWARLWRWLDRPGDPPELPPIVAAMVRDTLIETEPRPAGLTESSPGGDAYRMHPVVSDAIRTAAGPQVRYAVDMGLASYWTAVATSAEQRDSENSALIVRAGLAAAPYLLRRGAWDEASALLEKAVRRDETPGTIQVALPALRQIATETERPKHKAVLARALLPVRPADAEELMRDTLRDAEGEADYCLCVQIARDLATLLRTAGRLKDALEFTAQQSEYTRRAGLGPWTQLADQQQRLQVLGLMGSHEEVLQESAKLRDQMASLPPDPGHEEAVYQWAVREAILDTAWAAAIACEDWRLSLDLNAEVLQSKRAREAGSVEIARTQMYDAVPLIKLDRLDEAGQQLGECQVIFEDAADPALLAMVLGFRAELEDIRGHGQAAVDLARAALRYEYARGELREIAVDHHHLASYLRAAGFDAVEQRAHRLAAAIVFRLTGLLHDLEVTTRALANDLAGPIADVRLPATVNAVISVVQQTSGVLLRELLDRLGASDPDAEQAMQRALQEAAELAPTAADPVTRAEDEAQDAWSDSSGERLPPGVDQQWLPVIDEIVAVARGDHAEPVELTQFLDNLATTSDWSALVALLRRILVGETDPAELASRVSGLDLTDNAIIELTLAQLFGDDSDELKGWRARRIADRTQRSSEELI